MERSRLPLDVYHEIIDAVALDPEANSATLAACALIERSWLPRARFGLYNKVVLRGNKQCLIFSQALLDCSALGPLVHDLMLFSVWTRWDRDSIKGQDDPDPFPLQAVRKLSNLKNMTFEFNGGEVIPPNPIIPFLREVASRPSLRTLGLGSFTFHSVDDLVEILAAGPHLTSVFVAACIFNCEFSEGISRAAFAPEYCRDLRTVVVSLASAWVCSYRNLMPFGSHAVHRQREDGPTASRTTFSVRYYQFDSGSALARNRTRFSAVLRGCYPQRFFGYGACFVHGTTFDADLAAAHDALDLPNFTRLKNLVFLAVDTGTWVADALAMVRSPALQVLSLFCWCEELDSNWGSVLQDMDLPLQDIDALLSKAPFLGLQRICVTVFCREPAVRSDDSSSSEAEDSASDAPKQDESVSEDQAGNSSSSPSEREDATEDPTQDGVWFEQQVRKYMPSCHDRGILEVHAKVRVLVML